MVWRSSFLLFPEKEIKLTLLTLKLTVKAVKLNTAVKVWKRRRENLLKFEENIIYKRCFPVGHRKIVGGCTHPMGCILEIPVIDNSKHSSRETTSFILSEFQHH